MKIVKIISFDEFFFDKIKFKSISTEDEIESESKYLIYQNNELSGSISVAEDEIRKIALKIGADEKYILQMAIRILERKAVEKKMVRFYIYSDTKHVDLLEGLGFIKRKRFFDNHDSKYFQMFKIV
jgi:citrate lyase synthetase